MIPADHFRDNGDGTAWLICPNTTGEVAFWHRRHRPCDTCDGSGDETMDSMLAVGVPGGQYPIGPCPDCDGTGRHTFTIEVASPDYCQRHMSNRTHIDTCERWSNWVRCEFHRALRVSVVPDMVLPIVEPPPSNRYPAHSFIMHASNGFVLYLWRGMSEWKCEGLVTLPDAAAPGMWAVKLRVVS